MESAPKMSFHLLKTLSVEKFLGGSVVKNQSALLEMHVQSLGWKDPLEKEKATHPNVLAWEIPWTEEPGGLWFTGSQRVRHHQVNKKQLLV